MVPPRDVTGGIRGGRPRMGGDRTPKPPVARSEKARKRVLFVCIGNACRSQMAEAFARAYGSDILTVRSAGLAPAGGLPPLTRQVLAEKNVSAEGQFPKGLESIVGEPFEVVVNLSGESLPAAFAPARVIEWRVRDPIRQSESVYRAVAAEIEGLVMRLILELRES
jgi:arsenate reductase (thioredoxin)